MAKCDEDEKIKMAEFKNGKNHSTATSKTQNVTIHLFLATFAAVVGSAFQHGYNTGVVNAPVKILEKWIREVLKNQSIAAGEIGVASETFVNVILATIVSVFCFGGMIGGLCVGVVSEIFGRKGGILFNNIFVFVSALLMGFAKSQESIMMLIIGRLFIGVNAGINAGLIPMYLSEISPLNLRGMIGSSYQLIITVSILLSQILGLESILGNENHWPILLSLIVVPAFLQLVLMPACVESPKYLWSKGQEQSAIEALHWLRCTSDVQSELDLIKSESDAQKSAGKITLSQMLTNPMLRIPMIISIVIMLAQQLSGINAVIFYSTKIFKSANLSDDMAQIGTIAMGAMNVAMTLASSILVEAAGRKTLLLIGFVGMLIDTILLTIALPMAKSLESDVIKYMPVVLVIGFVVIFAVGPGSIPWFLVSELFMQNARPMATSIAVGINWSANFFVGLGFPILHSAMNSYVFVLFAFLQLLFTIFILKKVPETKNKTTEEISAIFRQMSYE
ncbi:hypothetical protein PGB90_000723 [Kerria lacca]